MIRVSCVETDNLKFARLNDEIIMAQRVRSAVLNAIHEFFAIEHFVWVDPPILHEQIPGKKHEIYLSQLDGRYSLNSSNALYLAAYSSIFERVCAISPTFRHEQDSINHLTEFRMLEAEMLHVDFSELINFVERLIVHVLKAVRRHELIHSDKILSERLDRLVADFRPKCITYDRFVEEIRRHERVEFDPDVDLSSIDYIISRYIEAPVFITHYPFGTWTAARNPQDGSRLSFNLILPETFGELCEGCERTNDTARLENSMRCASITNLRWYIDSVKRIASKRAGFGLGIDRLVRWIVGAREIQSTVIFYR